MIYLDNAATTAPYNNPTLFWGNASSLYALGSYSRLALNDCKNTLSQIFKCDKEGIVFTSGATEANNWVLRNIINKKILECKDIKPHVIISPIEHPSVMNVVKYYVEQGLINLSYLIVDEKGHVLPQELIHLINDNTCLVSCMYANNEIGSIQPIEKIGDICEQHGIMFHVDATQAVGKIDIDVIHNNIDYLTFSGHKFHGPKGIGALICSSNILLNSLGPFMFGGHQQNGYRAGTENVDDIVSMTSVLNNRIQMHGYDEIKKKTKEINLYIENKLRQTFNDDEYIINSYDYEMPVFNVSFKNISGEYIVEELNKKEIYISTGSACTSGDLSPSYVLQAIKCPEEYIQGTIRISFDFLNNTMDDIDILFDELKTIIKN